MSSVFYDNQKPVYRNTAGTTSITLDSVNNQMIIDNTTSSKTITINSEQFSNGTQVLPYIQMYENINAVDATIFPAPNSTTMAINKTLKLDDTIGGVGFLEIVNPDLLLYSTSGQVAIQTKNTNTNATHYLTFVDTTSTTPAVLQQSSGISCNPNTNSITATGTITGGTISGAIQLTSDNTSGTYYIPFSKTTGSGALFIDPTTSPLTYNPSTGVLTATEFSGATFNNSVVNTSVNFGTNTSSGSVNLGSAMTTGSLNIGNGTGWNSTTGGINIGNGTFTNPLIMRIMTANFSGAGTLNIMTGSNTGTGIVNIGNSSNTTININSNALFSNPISTSITNAPSSSRHLGYSVVQSTSGWTTSITSNTDTNITSQTFTSSDYGTWLFEGIITFSLADNTSDRQLQLDISSVSATTGVYSSIEYSTANVGAPTMKTQRIFNIYANTTIYLVGRTGGTNSTIVTSGGSGIFKWTRIG